MKDGDGGLPDNNPENARWLAELNEVQGHRLQDMMQRWYPGLRDELANAWRSHDFDRVFRLLVTYPKQDSLFPGDTPGPISRQHLVRARILSNIPDTDWRQLLQEVEAYRDCAVSEGVSAETYDRLVAELMDTVNSLRKREQQGDGSDAHHP